MGSKQRQMRRLLDFKTHACTYDQAKAMVDSMQGHASTLPQHHQMNLRNVADALEDLMTIAAGSVPESRAAYAETSALLPPALDTLPSPANTAPAELGGKDIPDARNQDPNKPAPATTGTTQHKSRAKIKWEDTEVFTPVRKARQIDNITEVSTPVQGTGTRQMDNSKQEKQDGDKKRKRDEGPPEDGAAGKKVKKEAASHKDGNGEGKSGKGGKDGKGKQGGKGQEDRGKDGKDKGAKDGKQKSEKPTIKKEQSSKGQPEQSQGDAAASSKKAKKSKA